MIEDALNELKHYCINHLCDECLFHQACSTYMDTTSIKCGAYLALFCKRALDNVNICMDIKPKENALKKEFDALGVDSNE